MKADLVKAQPSGMELLAELSRKTDDPQAAVAIAKAAVDLQIQMDRFRWESQDRQARIDFDDALKACQEKVGRIAPNRTRENNIAWADYAELDRVLRPIYTAQGFSIAFSESETLREGKVLICATLSRSGQNKQFFQSVTPAGNQKMNAADMEAAGQSRAQRYLLLKIFNVAIGIDADEKAPFYDSEHTMEVGAHADFISSIEGTATVEELQTKYFSARDAAKAIGDERAERDFAEAKNKQFRSLAKSKGASHA